jgi:hypothetical protein
MGDIMSHYIDRAANETTVDTAIKRETLLGFANLYGYKPSGPTPSTVDLVFTNTSDVTVDIPVGTQVLAPLSYGPFSEAYFEVTSGAVGVIPGQSITLPAEEGKTVNTDRPDLIDAVYNKPLPANIGLSTGLASQSIPIPFDTNILDNSIIAYVGQGSAFAPWKYVDNLLEQTPDALVFTTVQNTDGTLNLVFGDGITGAIPPANQLISAIYKTSVGASGNVITNAVKEVTFIPGNIVPEAKSYLTVTNSAPAVGGADGDNSSQLQAKIKAAIATRRRAVTLADYENLTLMVPRVGRAKASAAYSSSINLYVQSQNDLSTLTPGIALNQQIISSVAASTPTSGSATYTTSVDHGYVINDIVTIAGITPTGYNAQKVLITGVPTTSSFTIANATTASVSSVAGATVVNPKPFSSWNSLSSTVQAYLADKVPVGTTITIQPPDYTPIYLGITINIDAANSQSDIVKKTYAALIGTSGIFAYDKNSFGRTVYVSQIISAIQGIEGVTGVTIGHLNVDNNGGSGNLAFAANQIPYLTAANLGITVSGGIIS